jgi:hypothetical protein
MLYSVKFIISLPNNKTISDTLDCFYCKGWYRNCSADRPNPQCQVAQDIANGAAQISSQNDDKAILTVVDKNYISKELVARIAVNDTSSKNFFAYQKLLNKTLCDNMRYL